MRLVRYKAVVNVVFDQTGRRTGRQLARRGSFLKASSSDRRNPSTGPERVREIPRRRGRKTAPAPPELLVGGAGEDLELVDRRFRRPA